jgi:hypothetical protein
MGNGKSNSHFLLPIPRFRLFDFPFPIPHFRLPVPHFYFAEKNAEISDTMRSTCSSVRP